MPWRAYGTNGLACLRLLVLLAAAGLVFVIGVPTSPT